MKSIRDGLREAMEGPMEELASRVRNSALESAARVAKLYGAPDEACRRILMLKAASTRSGPEGEQ
jgi:hypothetical protein